MHASLTALLAAGESDEIAVLAAFDHEELGSESRTGASGPLLADVLARTGAALGAGTDEQHRAWSRSFCVSSDAGHAVHPNYPERHDPANRPLLNGGPLLKINANQRYASEGVGMARWRAVCRRAGVGVQTFVSNNAHAVRLDHRPAHRDPARHRRRRRGHPDAVHALRARAHRRPGPARPRARADGVLVGVTAFRSE